MIMQRCQASQMWFTELKTEFFFSSYYLFYFLIGVKLLYNIVWVSAVQWCRSAIGIHVSPPSWASLHPPTPLCHHRAADWVSCVILYNSFSPAIFFTHESAYMSMLLSLFIPLLLPVLCPQVHSLYLCLHSFPAQVHPYHFSKFHIHVLIYYICCSLSDLHHSI